MKTYPSVGFHIGDACAAFGGRVPSGHAAKQCVSKRAGQTGDCLLGKVDTVNGELVGAILENDIFVLAEIVVDSAADDQYLPSETDSQTHRSTCLSMTRSPPSHFRSVHGPPTLSR